MEKIRTMNDVVLAFDALGKSAKEGEDGKLILSESDIDTWSENVETRFGKDGVLNAYRKARLDEQFEFVLLEPHVPKLKGMAEYSERCTTVSRNEMMRIVDTATGKKVESLDAASSLVRNDIKYLIGQEDLNNLFIRYNK
jgi:hypothetical protein